MFTVCIYPHGVYSAHAFTRKFDNFKNAMDLALCTPKIDSVVILNEHGTALYLRHSILKSNKGVKKQ